MTPTTGMNLHIYPAPIVSESRIFRQTHAISRSGLFNGVEVCGTSAPGLPAVEKLTEGRVIRRVGSGSKGNGSVLGRVAHQIRWSSQVYRMYARSHITTVNAHSVAVLPVAATLARRTGARLIYDTHELETESATSRGLQGRIFRLIERLVIRKCDVVFVVNDLIKDWYERTYPGVPVMSVINSPVGEDIGSAHDLRTAFDVPPECRLYVHVGNLGAGRHIPELIRAFADRPGHHLVFLGDGSLRPLVDEATQVHVNIHCYGSVASASVVPTLSTADVGICLIELSCLSYTLSLPNKAIEYIAAEIPFIHNELPAVELLLSGKLENFRLTSIESELGVKLDSISTADITKGRSELAHVSLPRWETEAGRMIDAYRTILGRDPICSTPESIKEDS